MDNWVIIKVSAQKKSAPTENLCKKYYKLRCKGILQGIKPEGLIQKAFFGHAASDLFLCNFLAGSPCLSRRQNFPVQPIT